MKESDKRKAINKFFSLIGENKEEIDINKAARYSIDVAVKENPTYSPNISHDKIRHYWEDLLINDLLPKYRKGRSLKSFIKDVDSLKSKMNEKFPEEFKNNGKGEDSNYDKVFRTSHAQKSLSVFLKYMWCLDKIPMPPACPIDRIILKAVHNNEAWTKLNSSEKLKKYIDAVEDAANKEELKIAEWELIHWNVEIEKANEKKKSTKIGKKIDKNSLNPYENLLPLKNKKKKDEFIEGEWIILNGEPFRLFVAKREGKGFFCQLCYKYEEDEAGRNKMDINSLSDTQKIMQKFRYKWQGGKWKTFKYVMFNNEKDAIKLMNDILSFANE